jgi:hypothetical protein
MSFADDLDELSQVYGYIEIPQRSPPVEISVCIHAYVCTPIYT